jgi:hypothetical protein
MLGMPSEADTVCHEGIFRFGPQTRKSAALFDDLTRQLQNSEIQTVTSARSESRSEMIGIAASHSAPLSGCKADTFDP